MWNPQYWALGQRIVTHNTFKLLLGIKSFTQYKVINIRLSSKALNTLVQLSCDIHINITDTVQWAWLAVLRLFFLFSHPGTPSIAQGSHYVVFKAIGNRTPADSISSDCSELYKSQASSPLWSKKLTCKHRVMAVHHCWQLLTFPGTAACNKLHCSFIFAFL